MIVYVHCEHCGHNFEAEAMGKTTACPDCEKETRFDLRANAPLPAAMRAESGVSEGIIFCGYLGAVLMPFIGFFIGIYLLAKQQAGHGAAIMAISVLCSTIWLAILSMM
jgi:hypothetical protein